MACGSFLRAASSAAFTVGSRSSAVGSCANESKLVKRESERRVFRTVLIIGETMGTSTDSVEDAVWLAGESACPTLTQRGAGAFACQPFFTQRLHSLWWASRPMGTPFKVAVRRA